MADANARGETNHPYTRIIKFYDERLGSKRPKILGLTASPGNQLVDVAKLAATMSARYLRPPSGSSALRDMETYMPDVETIIKHVKAPETWELYDTLCNYLPLEGQIARTDGDFISACVQLAALVRCCGRGYDLVQACSEAKIHGVPNVPVDLEKKTPNPNTLYTLLQDSSQLDQYDALIKITSEMEGSVSPVLKDACTALLSLLAKNGAKNFRGILFVSTTAAAVVAVKMIETSKVLNPNGTLKPIFLVGISNGGMTMRQQKKNLDSFRDGTSNVLVATTVAEEGLDIRKCCIVIRTEPVTKIIANIQGRGRARATGALYLVLTLSKKEHKNAVGLGPREK